VRDAHPRVGRVIGVGMTSFAVAEIGYDERNYDNWLVTLVQASERLDVLQTVVNELRRLCEREDVVQSRQVMEVLERHGAIT
jgi:hypothetical protein